jgi:hypothetical protein
MRLKDGLLRHGFREVVEYLEDAEKNLYMSPPHLKDTLSNSRNAVESMLYELLRRHTITPVKKFSIDLSELNKKDKELVDEGTKALLQGTYSFLSVRGSHAFSPTESKDLSDAEFGLDQTYRMLSHIMTKLETLHKTPRPS